MDLERAPLATLKLLARWALCEQLRGRVCGEEPIFACMVSVCDGMYAYCCRRRSLAARHPSIPIKPHWYMPLGDEAFESWMPAASTDMCVRVSGRAFLRAFGEMVDNAASAAELAQLAAVLLGGPMWDEPIVGAPPRPPWRSWTDLPPAQRALRSLLALRRALRRALADPRHPLGAARLRASFAEE
jgi:hypothetical protein